MEVCQPSVGVPTPEHSRQILSPILIPAPPSHTSSRISHSTSLFTSNAPSASGKRASYRLAQGPALPNSNLITLLNTESRRYVCSQIAMSLLVTVIFWNIVEIISSYNNGTVHLCRYNSASKDTTTDGHKTSEWTFLV